MALAGRRRGLLGRLPPLANSFPVAARLLTAACLALVAGPIPLRSLPPRPSPSRLAACLATVARRRTKGAEPSFAPLQETNPRTTAAWALPSRLMVIMLNEDQGSCCSRRPSPGVELSTPLRGDLESPPPAGFLPSSIITAISSLHTCLKYSRRPAWPLSAAINSRAFRPPGPAKLALNFAATYNDCPNYAPRQGFDHD